VTPTSVASVSWLAATAASETGTNRMNLLPVLVRSLRRNDPGSMRHATLAILGGADVMGVLG
jgi:hypothetical protein